MVPYMNGGFNNNIILCTIRRIPLRGRDTEFLEGRHTDQR